MQQGKVDRPFPFPALEEGPLKQRIRDLGERLDAHRKTRQAAHPELTLTGMYNVLDDCSGDHRSPRMEGSGEEDTRRLVIAATLLTRLVALNHERAAEEKRGDDHRSPSPPEANIQQNLAGTEPSLRSKIQNPQSSIQPRTPPGPPLSPPKSPPSKNASPPPARTPPPWPVTSANAPSQASNRFPKSSKRSRRSGSCKQWL